MFYVTLLSSYWGIAISRKDAPVAEFLSRTSSCLADSLIEWEGTWEGCL